MSMRTFLLLLFERETGMDYWVDAITNPDKGLIPLRDDVIGICKFAAMNHDQVGSALSELTGLAIDADTLRSLILRTFLRGYRLEKLQGMTADDYCLPASRIGSIRKLTFPISTPRSSSPSSKAK